MGRNTMLVLVMGALVGCARGDQGVGLTSGAFTSTAIGSGGETGTEAGASGGTEDGDDEAPEDPEDPDPLDPEGPSSSSGEGDASTGMAAGDEGSSGGPTDTGGGGDPVPEVGPWEDCAEANCADGIGCVGLDGLPDAFYCAPDCVDHSDCIAPAGSDATALCAIVTDGGTEPSHCALLCSFDGEPQGDCPDHMVCTPMPGASPAFSLCVP